MGAVIVGHGILLSLRTSSYGCECVWLALLKYFNF